MNKILLVGCGHMGSALLKAWISKTTYSFSVIDPKKFKLNYTIGKNVSIYKSLDQLQKINSFDIIIFAVTPQTSKEVLKQYSNFKFKKNVLFISIIAGKKISFFKKYLGKKNQFIRVMPNMPALVNFSMTAMVSSRGVLKNNKNKAFDLFNKIGEVLWMSNEGELDKITAISGSGPGYYFLFIDSLQKAAESLGFSKKISKLLVYQTALGSINLLLKNSKNAEQLSKNIAIKGGTTEAAFKIFLRNKKIYKITKQAINHAHKRAKQLGK